jgi:hypothetical protein
MMHRIDGTANFERVLVLNDSQRPGLASMTLGAFGTHSTIVGPLEAV